eukprot:2060067-Ditylum_brightwellii.AAC.1
MDPLTLANVNMILTSVLKWKQHFIADLKFECIDIFLWCEPLVGVETDLTRSRCSYPVPEVANAKYVEKDTISTNLDIGKAVYV